MKKCTLAVLLGALLVLAGALQVMAQEEQLTPRERALLKRVDQLEQRVQELEKQRGTEAQPAPEQPQPKKAQGETLRPFWSNGFKFETADQSVRMQAGALIQNDWTTTSRAGGGSGWAGTEFRRARLYLAGQVHDRVEFKAEYDFGNGDGTTRLKDVYIGLVKLPAVGNVRIGHFKEPFSLETLTSDAFVTFMERSLPINAFSPDRNTGIMLQNAQFGQRMTWAAGLFHDADDFGKNLNQNKAFTTRVTGLPWRQADDRLLHLGVAYSHRSLPGSVASFASMPEAHLAPKVVNTLSFPAKSDDLIGAEGAFLYGRASLQSEYMNAHVAAIGGPDPTFSGWYLTGSYFLTHDHRVYQPATGVFDRVIPVHNFRDGQGGCGAWETAIRYSHLDLSDSGIPGGKVDDLTLGLNWYLNPVTRLSCNYVVTNPSTNVGARILEMRSQIAF